MSVSVCVCMSECVCVCMRENISVHVVVAYISVHE